MKGIVIATDGSLAAQAAVEDGLELARDHGSCVTFVTVRPPTPMNGDPYYERAVTRGMIRARAAIEKALAAAENLRVEAEAEILEGDAADTIVRVADARRADLIVVGSRDRNVGPLLGSVSRAVVREANIPVLVAKHRATEAEAAA